MIDDVVNVLGETVDVGTEVCLQERVVFLIDLAERPTGLVGERALLRIEFEFLDQLGKFFFRELGTLGEHLGALRLPPRQQYTLQPPNHDDRQNDALIFVSFELAAQTLG